METLQFLLYSPIWILVFYIDYICINYGPIVLEIDLIKPCTQSKFDAGTTASNKISYLPRYMAFDA